MDINIISPFELYSKFANKAIKGKLSNIGLVPYGQTTLGTLHLADPIDACSELKPIKTGDEDSKTTSTTPIIVVKYGNCFPITKIKYA